VEADAAGPRAASWLAVERARASGGAGERWTRVSLDPLTRSQPRWRRRGAFVAATRAGGRRKKGKAEMDGGRRPSSPELDKTTMVKGEHTGLASGTREDEPTARIAPGEVKGGGLRRRRLAACKRGKTGGAARGRFKASGASPVFGELILGVGWDGGASREADERRLLGTGGNGGEAMPGGGGASSTRVQEGY
jgi:Protein of unknown function.